MVHPPIHRKMRIFDCRSPISLAKQMAERIVDAHYGETLEVELIKVMLMKAFLAGRSSVTGHQESQAHSGSAA